jgi:hypothetical protein
MTGKTSPQVARLAELVELRQQVVEDAAATVSLRPL